MLSNRQLEHKGTIKASEINHLLPHFKLLKSEMANLVNLVSLANCEQKIDTRIFHLQQYLVYNSCVSVFKHLSFMLDMLEIISTNKRSRKLNYISYRQFITVILQHAKKELPLAWG